MAWLKPIGLNLYVLKRITKSTLCVQSKCRSQSLKNLKKMEVRMPPPPKAKLSRFKRVFRDE